MTSFNDGCLATPILQQVVTMPLFIFNNVQSRAKQYLSLVLKESGLGARVGDREKRLAGINDEMRAEDEGLAKQLSRLEGRGEYALANWLRVLGKPR